MLLRETRKYGPHKHGNWRIINSQEIQELYKDLDKIEDITRKNIRRPRDYDKNR